MKKGLISQLSQKERKKKVFFNFTKILLESGRSCLDSENNENER